VSPICHTDLAAVGTTGQTPVSARRRVSLSRTMESDRDDTGKNKGRPESRPALRAIGA
jgi:hypothetical protein